MDNKTTTILFISYDHSEVKSININSHFIKYFKRYLLAISLFIILCGVGLYALLFQMKNINIENWGLTSRLHDINKKVELIDSLKLNEKLKNIQSNLMMIHTYLLSRGVLSNTGNAGGEPSINHESDFSKIGFFEEQSVLFKNSLESLPLGIPHKGPVSSGYGYRYNPFGGYGGEFHPGIDFKGQIGDSVFATADGTIIRDDWYSGYGKAVEIYHENGISTLYGHLTSICVTNGQQVKAGELIGFLGTTGRSTGPHVHYEIRKNGLDIDPNPYLKLY